MDPIIDFCDKDEIRKKLVSDFQLYIKLYESGKINRILESSIKNQLLILTNKGD